MGELLREVAVIRQQKKAFTLRVEAPDIEKAREFWRQQIENCVARERIASSRNKPSRFVQRDCQGTLEMNEPAIDFDMIALGRLSTKIGADASVDGDAASGDQLVTLST
jgi:hypothetical protein